MHKRRGQKKLYKLIYNTNTGDGYVYYQSLGGRRSAEGTAGVISDSWRPTKLDSSILDNSDNPRPEIEELLSLGKLGFWERLTSVDTWRRLPPNSTLIEVTHG